MEFQIYLILATTCLILPWTKHYGIIPLIGLLLALPVGNALSLYFYKWGLFFYDFYFFSLFIRLVKERQRLDKWMLGSMLLSMFYAVVALLGGTALDLYFMRDFRLVIYLMTLTVLIAMRYVAINISSVAVKRLALLSGVSCSLYAAMMVVGVFTFEDYYYVRNSYRYFAISSYFSFGFLVFSNFLPSDSRRGALYVVALVVSLLGVFLTGFRVMALVAVMLFVAGSIKSVRGSITLFVLLFLTAPVLLLTQGDSGNGAAMARIADLSPEIISNNIHYRFLPFFREYEKFSYLDAIIGGGFGQTFEIPWFYYRDTKDYISNSIDSTYLTLYAKFGFIGLIYLVSYIYAYSRILGAGRDRIVWSVVVVLSFLWMVYALPYQMASVGLGLALFAIGSAGDGKASGEKVKM